MRGLTTIGGGINFRGASVAGVVDAEGAFLSNAGDKTLSLHQAHVAGTVRLCGGFWSIGLVVLNRTVIEGRLRCDGAILQWRPAEPVPGDHLEPNVRGSAVEAISAVVRSGIGLGWRIRADAVDFTDARTTYLADDPATDWPRDMHLSGFTYERFAPLNMNEGHGEWDARVRGTWLSGLEPYDPRSWEQVARVLRVNGDRRGAEEILIAQRRTARHRRIGFEKQPWRVLFDVLQDTSVRYGHRPQRALVILLLLVAAVTLSLTPASAQKTMTATGAQGAVYTPQGQVDPPTSPSEPHLPCGAGRVRSSIRCSTPSTPSYRSST
jgi:hypothetical protein